MWTFRGALGYGFSQDDFLGLARATGHAPTLPFGWRWLSHQLFWQVVAGPLRMDARSAHVLSLIFHATASALLAWMLAKRLPAAAALAGAAFFASHPSVFTAVYWAAANGDVLAAVFSLAALACAFTPRARWAAVAFYALAILAKESALPLPLAWAAVAIVGPGRRTSARELLRDRVWWACIAVGLLLAVASALGPHRPGVGGEAYALSLGALPGNVLTYDGWAVNRWLATSRSFTDAVDPQVFAWGVGLNLVWIAGACVPALRRAGWIAAGVAWTILLAPVLPLANHTYHYYSYAALPATGLLVAAAFAAATSRAQPAAAWLVAAAVAGFCAVDGQGLVAKIEQMPFKVVGLRADAIVDRARIATGAIHDVQAARLPEHTLLHLWSPQSQAMSAEEGVPRGSEGYYEANVRAALLDGLAIRVMVPAVDSVVFERTFTPHDAGEWWAVYRFDGGLQTIRAGDLQRILAAGPPVH